jgi:hypothetical protein
MNFRFRFTAMDFFSNSQGWEKVSTGAATSD